jgi:hypothetical protein
LKKKDAGDEEGDLGFAPLDDKDKPAPDRSVGDNYIAETISERDHRTSYELNKVLPEHLMPLDWLDIESKIRKCVLAELKPYSKVQSKEKGLRKSIEFF